MGIQHLTENLVKLHQQVYRSKRIQKFMKNELVVPLPKLTKEQKKEIKTVWGGVNVDYRYFSFFNLFNNGKWSPYYIPSNLHYSLIDMFYTDYKRCRTIEDKNLNSLLFHDVKQPRTVIRKINGILLDDNYNVLDTSKIQTLFNESVGGYLIKPSIDSGGGRKIIVWKPNSNVALSNFIYEIDAFEDCIIQEFASQHENIASIHRSSLNTIRVISFFHNNDVIPLSTIMRMGAGGSSIDNASVGGIFVGVEPSGRLKGLAYDDYGNVYREHPTTHAVFKDHIIPNYNKIISLAKSLHLRLVGFSKLISWDFAVDAEGYPILIEVNATHGGISFHQMCNGPLFGDLTEDVIKEVFTSRNKLLSRIL